MHRRLLLAAAVAFPLGCSSSDDSSANAGSNGPWADASTADAATAKDAGVADASNGQADASAPGDSGALPDSGAHPGMDAGADAQDAALTLPFYVSDDFVPSGYMGDSQSSMMAITMAHDAATCKSPRMAGAGGDCYSITWAPTPPDGGSSWAGVYWQSPSGNWGTKPGKTIPPGATKVSFYAAGAIGGETIQACAGGIGGMSTAYADTFSVKSQPIALTTTWTHYELSLQGATYSSVLGGFCWVASTSTPTSSTFYIDDLRWE